MSSVSMVEIGLRPSQLKAVKKKAKDAGQSLTEFIGALVERELLADQSFDELLRPVHRDFKLAHVSESQLDEIVDRARKSPKGVRLPVKSAGRTRS
jgi:hypothetical protein